MSNQKRNRIVELDPEHFREVDGVVFDLDSFARHCAPHPTPQPTPQPVAQPPVTPSAAAQEDEPAPDMLPVFVCDPVHVGWYPIQIEGPSYPVMAGAIEPGQQLCYTGSGSSSYLTSYMTSFLTSFTTSWTTSWGSYWYQSSLGSRVGSFAGSGVLAGGYGLELI